MPSWPLTVPESPLVDAFGRSPKPNVISFGTEVGPGKVRRRSTARTKVVTARFIFTTAELADFEAFFEDDLEDGALAFDWSDPVDDVTKSFRFEPGGAYTVSALSIGLWNVSANLQLLP